MVCVTKKKEHKPSRPRQDFRHPVIDVHSGSPFSSRTAKLMRKILFKVLSHESYDPPRVMRRGI
jgi:hypothetical protein